MGNLGSGKRLSAGLLEVLIKEYVKEATQALDEEALSPDDSMALQINSGRHGVVFTLYNADMIPLEREESFDNIVPAAIVGSINRETSGEIHAPVAVKGFGPYMYELAMEFDPSTGIFSDRGGRSDSAKGVWQKFMQRPDIEKKLLEPDLREDDDPNNPANYRFITRRKRDLSALIANHDRIRGIRKKLGDNTFTARILGAAADLFHKRMPRRGS